MFQERLIKMTSLYKQVFRFGVTGVTNTFIDFGLFNMLVYFSEIHDGWQIGLINIFSIGLAATNSYLMNRHWTFKSEKDGSDQAVAKFIIATGLGMLINSLVVTAMASLAHWIPVSVYFVLNAGKLLGAVFSSTWNFLAYRYWVFKSTETWPRSEDIFPELYNRPRDSIFQKNAREHQMFRQEE